MEFSASCVVSTRRDWRNKEKLLSILAIETCWKDLAEFFTWKYLHLSMFMSVYLCYSLDWWLQSHAYWDACPIKKRFPFFKILTWHHITFRIKTQSLSMWAGAPQWPLPFSGSQASVSLWGERWTLSACFTSTVTCWSWGLSLYFSVRTSKTWSCPL